LEEADLERDDEELEDSLAALRPRVTLRFGDIALPFGDIANFILRLGEVAFDPVELRTIWHIEDLGDV
jgi:hypothetical protein